MRIFYNKKIFNMDSISLFSSIYNDIFKITKNNKKYFPKNIIFLSGAPGAGKSTYTPIIKNFIQSQLNPIIVSDLLLKNNKHKTMIEKGLLIKNEDVIKTLFSYIFNLNNDYNHIIIDGFPRTEMQSNFLKFIFKKHSINIYIIVLFVNSTISVQRQLGRGLNCIQNNKTPRKTDLCKELAYKRYEIFKKNTYQALFPLKKHFKYCSIDTSGNFFEVTKVIINNLKLLFKNEQS